MANLRMMKNSWFVFLFSTTFFFSGCGERPVDESLLKGTWVPVDRSQWFSSSISLPNSPISYLPLIMEDSSSGLKKSMYRMQERLLIVGAPMVHLFRCDDDSDKSEVNFSIEDISADTLTVRQQNGRLIKFKKMKPGPDSSVHLLECGFHSHLCMGMCPYYYLHLTRDSVFFQGLNATCNIPEGSRSAAISSGLLLLMDKAVAAVDWKNIDTTFTPGISDGWNYDCWIHTNRGKYYFAMQYRPEDPAMAQLIYYLLRVNTDYPMRTDTTFHRFPYRHNRKY